jgi:tetratricopeptide (TPR) repeat protein
MAWRRLGEEDKAISDFTEAIRLDPQDAAAYSDRANSWATKREYDNAIRDFTEAIRLDPKDVPNHFRRGLVRAEKGEYENAVKDYDEAIRLDPKYSVALNYRAWLKATCPDGKYRDGNAAVEDAKRACELTEWKVGGYIDTLAAAYAEAGDFAKAVEYQEKALEDKEFEKRAGKEARERLALFKAKKPVRVTKN